MRTLLIMATLSLAVSAQATTRNLTGSVAENLAKALYQSGFPAKAFPKADGFKFDPISGLVCVSALEQPASGGLLSSIRCYISKDNELLYNVPANKTLFNSKGLDTALEAAGADGDAAMGHGWTYAKNISCQATFLDQGGANYVCRMDVVNPD